MKREKFFFIIMIVPAVVLVLVAAFTAHDLYSIRKIDHAEMARALQTHLDQRKPTSFLLPDDIHSKDNTRVTIFVFGSSDALLSDGEVYSRYLEQQHPKLRVVNFGINGLDSFSIRQRVREALSQATPDVMIIYHGNGDYNTAYNEFILPYYFHRFHALLRIPYIFQDTSKPFSRFSSEPMNYYWFYVFNRPKLLKAFEAMHLLAIDTGDYEPINQIILEYFILNNAAILDMAASKRVPVVLITPVGNLHAEPIGDIENTQALYRKGIASADYRQSITYLRKAKDSEIFTFDLRAKSPLIDHIRGISRRGVYIMDLEKRLEAMHFGFGNEDFMDYVHFNDRSHRLLAENLYEFMAKQGLLRPSTRHQQ